jgi:hypothetical protein
VSFANRHRIGELRSLSLDTLGMDGEDAAAAGSHIDKPVSGERDPVIPSLSRDRPDRERRQRNHLAPARVVLTALGFARVSL